MADTDPPPLDGGEESISADMRQQPRADVGSEPPNFAGEPRCGAFTRIVADIESLQRVTVETEFARRTQRPTMTPEKGKRPVSPS